MLVSTMNNLKHIEDLTKVFSSDKSSYQPTKLTYPTSSSKKPKARVGDKKKQLEFEQVFCENVVW
jgi:hypothetical protein